MDTASLTDVGERLLNELNNTEPIKLYITNKNGNINEITKSNDSEKNLIT